MFILYTKTSCPYCERVKSAFAERKVSFEERNIALEKNLAELIERGGKRQVPFLVDESKGVSMYETADIIKYISANS